MLLRGKYVEAAPGTPSASPPMGYGRPAFRERPRRLAFAPEDRLALRLDPNPEERKGWRRLNWRCEIDAPPCRLVWIGDVIRAPASSSVTHVEALVQPLVLEEAGELLVVQVPITALALLSVGRVLKDELPNPRAKPSPYGYPGFQFRFLYNEWSVDLWFG